MKAPTQARIAQQSLRDRIQSALLAQGTGGSWEERAARATEQWVEEQVGDLRTLVVEMARSLTDRRSVDIDILMAALSRLTQRAEPSSQPADSVEAARIAVRDEVGSRLCDWLGRGTKRTCTKDNGLRVCLCEQTARAALLAARFPAAGVPERRPTEAMLIAARDWSAKAFGKPIGNDAAVGCWQAMFDALVRSQPTAPAASKSPVRRLTGRGTERTT